MDNPIHVIDNDDVLHTGASALMFQCTFKVSEFLAMMQAKLEEEYIFGDGLECDLLSPGQPWKKGKVKVRLEFSSSESVIPQVPQEGPIIAVPQFPNIPIPNETVDPEELPPPLRRQIHPVGMWS
ncbi:KGK domain protein [Lyngbya aestuarii BL J]|uniref:KGK domain protein n=1 Tax=Lyngbya aestuarii BL J TaxID=1348334 RepID=U7QMW7_9CYAN|nr:KGK domain protein [Lyngbya aestuarii]ERT07756.1 KGK domain protein [Lyngbya aestuarii BL J]